MDPHLRLERILTQAGLEPKVLDQQASTQS